MNDFSAIVLGTMILSTRRWLVDTRRRIHSLAGVTGFSLFLVECAAKVDDTKVVAMIKIAVTNTSLVFILFILLSLVLEVIRGSIPCSL